MLAYPVARIADGPGITVELQSPGSGACRSLRHTEPSRIFEALMALPSSLGVEDTMSRVEMHILPAAKAGATPATVPRRNRKPPPCRKEFCS